MPDYTIGIAERIASVADSTATSNSVNRNYFQETNQSVVNSVNVAIAPAVPTTLNPTPQTTYATATDDASVSTFGVQETPIVITLLATIDDAGILANYLLRSVPAYWFSNLAVFLNPLTDANKALVAQLEIGQQIAVTKTFPAGVVPQTVTEYLFVEGIDHEITVDSHTVTIYTGPASTYLQWVLGTFQTITTRTNLVTNPSFETNTTGWSAQGTTVSRVAGTFGSGDWVAQVVFTGAVGGGIYSDALPVVASQSYTASSTVLRTVGARSYFMNLTYYNSGGTQVGTFVGTAYACATATRLSVTGLAPATAATVRVLIYTSTTATLGDTFQTDSVLLEQSSSALPYFDGTYADAYTGNTLLTQQWNGTANASTSTTTWGLDSSLTGSPLNDATYGLA